MPIYEYHCKSCDRTFEMIRRMRDADTDLECPDCESEKVERLLSAFAAGGCGGGSRGRFT